MLLSILLSSSLLAPARARHLNNQIETRANGIQWGPCTADLLSLSPPESKIQFQCGNLTVPLDYTDDTSKRTLNLSLIKSPAVNQPNKGSILMNFGGPGGDGLTNMVTSAYRVQPMTGGYHDLISWDPRGTGNTLGFNCFANDTEATLSFINLHGDLANASDVAFGRTWGESEILNSLCRERNNEIGSLVGTVATVRDMFQIVDNLGEDRMLRYWGISYGTTLGATALAMFPDRIDRAVLDGVQNPHQYYNTFGDPEMYSGSDKTWEEFLYACMAMPNNCTLAKHAKSAAELGQMIDRVIEDVKNNPIPIGTSLFGYTDLKTEMLDKLYWPNQYWELALTLEAAMGRNGTELVKILTPSPRTQPPSIPVATHAILGIKCGDKLLRTTNIEDARKELNEQQYKISPRFGDIATRVIAGCAQWPFQAKEQYKGNFQAKTSYPVLIIGSPFDPVTSIVSARNVSSGFDGSVVLQHNGHGHVSFAQLSSCTISKIADYFVNGTLPKPGTICEPDRPLFVPRSR